MNKYLNLICVSLAFWLIILLSNSCAPSFKESEYRKSYAEKGLVPDTVIQNSFMGETISTFWYNYWNCGIIEVANRQKYEYEDGLITIGRLSGTQYNEYFYNEDSIIISYKNFLIENDSSILNKDYRFEMNDDDLVVVVREAVKGSVYKFTYHTATNNISSKEEFDEDENLLREEFYEYDNMNNVYKNIKAPFYYYVSSLINKCDNYVIKKSVNKYYPITNSYVVNNSYEYNEEKFPTKITSFYTQGSPSTLSIIYRTCE